MGFHIDPCYEKKARFNCACKKRHVSIVLGKKGTFHLCLGKKARLICKVKKGTFQFLQKLKMNHNFQKIYNAAKYFLYVLVKNEVGKTF